MISSLAQADLWFLMVALLAAGAFSGFLAGIFGVGGGIILVPVLYQLFTWIGVPEDIRMHLSAGTSLAIIIPTSIRSFRAHYAKGLVDTDVLKRWILPTFAGVMVGALVAAGAPSSVLKGIFAAVTTFNAIKLLAGRDSWRLSDTMPGPFLHNIYGLAMGFLSTLMGVGGGIFGNMVMTLHGVPIHRAVATSSGIGIIIAIPAAIMLMLAGWPEMPRLPAGSIGFVSLLGFIVVAPVSVITAPWGVKAAHGISKRKLEVGFGLFMLVVATRFAWSLWA
jgi:uncharacterized protein